MPFNPASVLGPFLLLLECVSFQPQSKVTNVGTNTPPLLCPATLRERENAWSMPLCGWSSEEEGRHEMHAGGRNSTNTLSWSVPRAIRGGPFAEPSRTASPINGHAKEIRCRRIPSTISHLLLTTQSKAPFRWAEKLMPVDTREDGCLATTVGRSPKYCTQVSPNGQPQSTNQRHYGIPSADGNKPV